MPNGPASQDQLSQLSPRQPLSLPADDRQQCPKALILLATFNGALWISEQLDSILAQRDVTPYVVIRDDGSTDDTLKQIAQFSHDSRVHLLANVSPTHSAAQNFFALIKSTPASGFDLVAFSDQDDIWNPDKLIRAYRCLKQTDAAGYSSATTAYWPDGRRHHIPISGAQTNIDFLYEGAGQGATFALTSTCYQELRNFLLDNPSLFQNIYFHDWAIYALIRAMRFRWHFDHNSTMLYRQHSTNVIGARGTLRSAALRIRRVSNGWYSDQLSRINSICLQAAPDSNTFKYWDQILHLPHGFTRRVKTFMHTLSGGRRRKSHNFAILLACVFGRI